MKNAVRQTRSHLMELFARHGFHPRTDFGQNFLIDLNLVDLLAREGRLGPDDVVLEVGTGTGSLTAQLAAFAAEVITVEVDSRMVQLAHEVVDGLSNVTLLHQDALENKNHLAPEVLELIARRLEEDPRRRLKLVANLPYSIATPIVSNLVDPPAANHLTAPRTPQYALVDAKLPEASHLLSSSLAHAGAVERFRLPIR